MQQQPSIVGHTVDVHGWRSGYHLFVVTLLTFCSAVHCRSQTCVILQEVSVAVPAAELRALQSLAANVSSTSLHISPSVLSVLQTWIHLSEIVSPTLTSGFTLETDSEIENIIFGHCTHSELWMGSSNAKEGRYPLELRSPIFLPISLNCHFISH